MNNAETVQEIETTTAMVTRLLQLNSLARNSSNATVYLVWKEILQDMDVELNVPYSIFKTLPSSETITRVKRDIQNTKKECMSDEQVYNTQQEKSKEFKQYYAKHY